MNLEYILLTISITACLTATLQKNSFSKNRAKNGTDMHLFNLVSSVVCAVMFLIIALASGVGVSAYTAILGCAFGVVSAISAYCGLNAYKKGPASYTNLLIMSSMVIPALSGALFFNESIGVGKIIGVVLVLVAIGLSVCNKADKKASFSWLVVTLLAALFTGLIGVMQKIHQSSPSKHELMWFLCIAFAISAASSIVCLCLNKGLSRITVKTDGRLLLFMLGCGIAVLLNNAINLYLSGVMDSIIFYPTVNGANILLLLIASLVFLKEKIRPLQWVGIAAGFAAIILLCI